ncbi:hypothetical protein BU16DRAFT_537989 [Lophium mytilinum]|uniref:Uncharacterized protein n=1 Tax=Lophium mytilinum TaxID=390894 RepID=A0A6A6QWP2_9PEZI|nr:hypothetical protein BU16DRAFT_537989 [Lophium mytilinum]
MNVLGGFSAALQRAASKQSSCDINRALRRLVTATHLRTTLLYHHNTTQSTTSFVATCTTIGLLILGFAISLSRIISLYCTMDLSSHRWPDDDILEVPERAVAHARTLNKSGKSHQNATRQPQGPSAASRRLDPTQYEIHRNLQRAGLPSPWDGLEIEHVAMAAPTTDGMLSHTGRGYVGGYDAGGNDPFMGHQELSGNYVSQHTYARDQQHMAGLYGRHDALSRNQHNRGDFYGEPAAPSMNRHDMFRFHPDSHTQPMNAQDDRTFRNVSPLQFNNIFNNIHNKASQYTGFEGRGNQQSLRPKFTVGYPMDNEFDNSLVPRNPGEDEVDRLNNHGPEDMSLSEGGSERSDVSTPASRAAANPDYATTHKSTESKRGKESSTKDPLLKNVTENADGLFFASYAEAQSVYTEKARWTPPLLKASPTQAEYNELVLRLRDAIHNMNGIADNSNHKFQKWRNFVYESPAIELVAHKLVNMMIKLHLEGWRIPILDPTDLASSRYEELLDFNARFEAVEDLLWFRKSACGSLLDGSLYEATVAAPNSRWNSYLANQKANQTKKIQIKVGREHLGLKTKGNKRDASEMVAEGEDGYEAVPMEPVAKRQRRDPQATQATSPGNLATPSGHEHAGEFGEDNTELGTADALQNLAADALRNLAADTADAAGPSIAAEPVQGVQRVTRSRASGLATPKNAERGVQKRKGGKAGA